ncbi:hypothetical protein OG21DRAFT_1298537 [Imleria badia]|nr:hypothetical protein OG21DRAFT_1298537 [Imleria badia]
MRDLPPLASVALPPLPPFEHVQRLHRQLLVQRVLEYEPTLLAISFRPPLPQYAFGGLLLQLLCGDAPLHVHVGFVLPLAFCAPPPLVSCGLPPLALCVLLLLVSCVLPPPFSCVPLLLSFFFPSPPLFVFYSSALFFLSPFTLFLLSFRFLVLLLFALFLLPRPAFDLLTFPIFFFLSLQLFFASLSIFLLHPLSTLAFSTRSLLLGILELRLSTVLICLIYSHIIRSPSHFLPQCGPCICICNDDRLRLTSPFFYLFMSNTLFCAGSRCGVWNYLRW